MIDASHDNSGKDHERQPARRRPTSRAQVAAGNAAIVGRDAGVVPRRRAPGARRRRALAYGQSITDACMDWDTTVGGARRGWRAAVRARRAAWPR